MKKLIIRLEGRGENEKALALGYAAERVLKTTPGVKGMVKVKDMDNWIRRLWKFCRKAAVERKEGYREI